MAKRTVRDVDVTGKRVLVRVDFNVPLKDGKVADDTRIRASLATIEYLRERHCRVILMSHLGRPKDGPDESLRMDPVAMRLARLLSAPVRKVDELSGPGVEAAVEALGSGDVLLLENSRFDPREKKNDPALVEELASLGDLYVNDAFSAAHRAHATTAGLAGALPSVAGFQMEKELVALDGLLSAPKRPFVVVLGGAKVTDKIKVIDRFLDLADALLIGGAMSFTFLKAQGCGRRSVEGRRRGPGSGCGGPEEGGTGSCELLLPTDVVVARGVLGRLGHPGGRRRQHAPGLDGSRHRSSRPRQPSRRGSPTRGRCSGTVPWASSRWNRSRAALGPSPRPWLRVPPSRWWEEATPSPRSTSSAWQTRWITSPWAAGLRSRCSKARSCPAWPPCPTRTRGRDPLMGDRLRRPLMAGNWKMYKTSAEGASFVSDLARAIGPQDDRDVVVAPTFVGLYEAVKAAAGTGIGVAAQDVFWEAEGAYTGEVSPRALAALGVVAAIIGHSERRQHFAETDNWVAMKMRAALDHGLLPIMCVGETGQERAAGLTEEILSTQVPVGLTSVRGEELEAVAIAYEPIWAIGTGRRLPRRWPRRLRPSSASRWASRSAPRRLGACGCSTAEASRPTISTTSWRDRTSTVSW